MLFSPEEYEIAAVAAVTRGRFIEAAVLWHQCFNSKSQCTLNGCTDGFSLTKCANCLQTYLRDESLSGFDHEYYGFALISLKNWRYGNEGVDTGDIAGEVKHLIFDVTYEDGSVSTDRKVPIEELGSFYDESHIKDIITAQDIRICELTGWVRPTITLVERKFFLVHGKKERQTPRRVVVDRRVLVERRNFLKSFDIVYGIERRNVQGEDDRRLFVRREQNERRRVA